MAVGTKFKVALQGTEELRERLGLAQAELEKGIAAGLYAVGQNIRANSMARVPLDKGALKNSHHVTAPTGVHMGKPLVIVGCGGGPARPYALIQHERLDFKHSEGEAKFLERAANEELARAPALVAKIAAGYLVKAAKKGGGGGNT